MDEIQPESSERVHLQENAADGGAPGEADGAPLQSQAVAPVIDEATLQENTRKR